MQRLSRYLVAGFAALLLAGCGTAVKLNDPAAPHKPAPATPNAIKDPTMPALPAAKSGRGGYYKDDGPADDTPPNLIATPDAVPRVEPYSVPGNRPYVVFGKTYTPITDNQPFIQTGLGTWYGKKFHGQKTSSGERYDMFKMTAAHPTLPIPSFARVTNLANGAQVIVRINDRGPFHSTRIIDLSYTAALKLGYISNGSGQLQVERLLPDDIAALEKNPSLPTSFAKGPPLPQTDVIAGLISDVDAGKDKGTDAGIYLQFGVYAQQANAEAVLSRLLPNWAVGKPSLEIVEYGAMFRVYSGPYATRAAAETAAAQVRAAGVTKPVIVVR